MIRSTVWRYGVAVLLVGIAATFLVFWERAGNEPAVAPLMLAILLTGWLGGGGPVALATVLSLALYVGLAPASYFAAGGAHSGRLVWVSAFAGATAWYSAALRRTAARLEQARRDLEDRVQERTADLRRSEELLLAAQRMSHTFGWRWDVRTGEFHWSKECEELFGRDPSTIGRAQLHLLWHPDDRNFAENDLETAFIEKRAFDRHLRILRPDGTIRYVRCAGRPVFTQGGELVEYLGVMMDMTELREAEINARAAREEAAEARFSAMLDERARLARELHDTLLQGFTGVGLKLVAVTKRVEGPPETVAALREVIASAQSTLENARRAIWDMRPALSGGDEFVSALRAAAEEGVRDSAVKLEFRAEGSIECADAAIETALFRVAQEAIANVVLHANASTVRVTLAYEATCIRLTVADDGRGFVVDPEFRAFGGHLGLLGMKERAAQARGTLSIASAPGRGTVLELHIPCALREKAQFPVVAAPTAS